MHPPTRANLVDRVTSSLLMIVGVSYSFHTAIRKAPRNYFFLLEWNPVITVHSRTRMQLSTSTTERASSCAKQEELPVFKSGIFCLPNNKRK